MDVWNSYGKGRPLAENLNLIEIGLFLSRGLRKDHNCSNRFALGKSETVSEQTLY